MPSAKVVGNEMSNSCVIHTMTPRTHLKRDRTDVCGHRCTSLHKAKPRIAARPVQG